VSQSLEKKYCSNRSGRVCIFDFNGKTVIFPAAPSEQIQEVRRLISDSLQSGLRMKINTQQAVEILNLKYPEATATVLY